MNTSRPPGPGAGTDSLSRSSSDKISAPLQPSLGDGMSGSGDRLGSQSGRQAGSQGSGQVGSQGIGQAESVADSLTKDMKAAAQTATRAVKQQASDFAANVGEELSKTAEDQKRRGVEAIQGFARAITTAAAELENQSPLVARYVRDAAQKVEGLSGNISSRDVTQLMKATWDLARAQPLLFLGGAVAAGFALSRFLKSSARTNSESSESNGSAQSDQSNRSGQFGQSNMGRSSPSTMSGQSASPTFPARG